MKALHSAKYSRFSKHSERKTGQHGRRLLSMLLCLCMVVSMMFNFGGMVLSSAVEATDYVLNRIADGDTMDSYNLLSSQWGSRYAGRVWTDKTVFAYGDNSTDWLKNVLSLHMSTDGLDGEVTFNSDFAHIFSALASSQLVNEWPQSPIDLVIVFDMSASMAHNTEWPIEAKYNESNLTAPDSYLEPMSGRIANSRIQKTLDAINNSIDTLMAQNPNNRVSVVGYGAGASVLMPLAHYEKIGDEPYLSVGGMETLNVEDLLYIPIEWGQPVSGWFWGINKDEAYTVVANAKISNSEDIEYSDGENYHKTVSNNVKSEDLHPMPGYAEQTDTNMSHGNDDEAARVQLAADEYIGYLTNTQGGIYLGYRQLAQAEQTTYTVELSNGEAKTVARIPAAIIMTDGGANFAFNEMSDWNAYYGKSDLTYEDEKDLQHQLIQGGTGGNTGDEWYKVFLPNNREDGEVIDSLYNPGISTQHLHAVPLYYNPGILYSSDSDVEGTPSIILQVIMTASYMKTVVNKHYEAGWSSGNATDESRISLSTYTISVDSDHVPAWGRYRLYPSLNPADYFFSDKYWENAELFGGSEGKAKFEAALNEWNQWKNGSEIQAEAGTGNVKIKISPLESDGYYDHLYGVTVTNNDIVDNIAYNDGFYDVGSTEVESIFQTILSQIIGQVFVPLSGDNDAGVADSITYQDPLGEYMEIKNGAITAPTHAGNGTYDMALLLFGELHGINRSGVYDYHWNDDWIVSHGGTSGEAAFVQGWYRGDDPKNAESGGTGSVPYKLDTEGKPIGEPLYDNPLAARADGWVFRFNFITASAFIPLLSGINTPGDIPEQMQNTVYTIYQFASSGGKEAFELRRNPIYGDVTPEMQAAWDLLPENNIETAALRAAFKAQYPAGTYQLNDIRIWLEHTGDYVDSSGTLTPEAQSNYDDSLYINIPIAALPTQVAEITMGPNGPISYKTNLGSDHPDGTGSVENGDYVPKEEYYAQSTPFRVLYAVGLQEDLILRDSEGKQTGIDISKISGEYIQSHTDPTTKNIYFISNWYSNTNYTGYTSDESIYGYSTRGDAAVSISPDAKNRYYLFQKPLPLIAHAFRVLDESGTVAPVDKSGEDDWGPNKSGNSGTTWETLPGEETPQSAASWIGGEFIGTYKDQDAFREALQTALARDDRLITDAKGYTYNVPNDITKAVITYLDDQLTKVESKSDGSYTNDSLSFSSDDYFFLCIEYYMPIPNTVGEDIEGNPVPGTTQVRKISYMIARKGSAFGSGLHSEHIGNGDMLCWTDINGNCRIEIEYNSFTVTGDKTRGQPTFEKLTLKGDDLMAYLRDTCGLNTDKNIEVANSETGETEMKSYLDIDYEYWTKIQSDPNIAALIKEIQDAPDEQAKFNELFDWSVATRTGGIRVGDMFNNVQIKGGVADGATADNPYYTGNRTKTANNYYIPTLSENSTIGDGLIINNYLGNNGRMEIVNATLMATKQLVAPAGFSLTDKQEDEIFDYQVYVQGVTGERQAQRIIWNPLSQSWQKRVETLDILTDNSSLLMYQSGGRALFCIEPDGSPRLVVENIVNGETKYFYADANGNATTEPCEHTDDLYYMYIPSNSSGDSDLTYHLFGSSYEGIPDPSDGDQIKNTEWIPNAGTTAYLPESMSSYVGQTGDNANQKFAVEITGNTENPSLNRPAGSREYWTSAAELIPYKNVYEAEHPADAIDSDPGSTEGIATVAIEAETDPPRWDHDSDHSAAETHKPLEQFTLVSVIPDPTGVDSTVYSPFSSRTTYMTVPLYFGYKDTLAAYLAANNKTFSECTTEELADYVLTQDGLYDKTAIDTTYATDARAIAENTAYFTMKHGEGILLTGLSANTDYRFTEKLTETQMNEGYTLKEVKHIQQNSQPTYGADHFAETPGLYSITGDIGSNTEQVHYTNTIDPDLFVLTKTLVDANGKEIPTSSNVEFTFYVTFSLDGDEPMSDMDDILHLWRGNQNMKGGGTWTDAGGNTHNMPAEAPTLDNYLNYLDPSKEFSLETISPLDPTTGDYPADTYKVTLKPGEAVVFYGLIAGTNYSVREEVNEKYPVFTDGTKGGHANPVTGEVKRASAGSDEIAPTTTHNRVNFKNEMKTGALTVEKAIHDDDKWEVDKTFTFTVTLTDADGKSLSEDDLTVTTYQKTKDEAEGETSEDITKTVAWTKTVVDGKTVLTADITLKHGERFVISGIPMGTTYTVKETDRDGYNLEYVVDRINGDPTDSNDFIHPKDFSTNGEITEDHPQANWLFVNAKPPVLPFSGSGGVGLFYLLGAALIFSGIVFMIFCGKRRVRVK